MAEREARVGIAVAIADDFGIHQNLPRINIGQQAAVLVQFVWLEPQHHLLPLDHLPQVAAGLLSVELHRLEGVDGLGRVHSDQPNRDSSPLPFHLKGVSVNRPNHLGPHSFLKGLGIHQPLPCAGLAPTDRIDQLSRGIVEAQALVAVVQAERQVRKLQQLSWADRKARKIMLMALSVLQHPPRKIDRLGPAAGQHHPFLAAIGSFGIGKHLLQAHRPFGIGHGRGRKFVREAGSKEGRPLETPACRLGVAQALFAAAINHALLEVFGRIQEPHFIVAVAQGQPGRLD